MALQIHCPSSLTSKPYHHLPHLHFPKTTRFTVRSQTPPDSSETNPAPPKKATSQGVGFGSSATSSSPNKPSVNSKERASKIIRRSPVEKPALLFSEEDEAKAKEMGTNESAFVVAWLLLGGVILAEGLALALSGFLPEEWDKLFVKYLYPSFTPTVGLFFGGTTVYGVIKYLQNEELKGKK